MKLIKRISMTLVLSLVITLIAPGFLYGNTIQVEAAVKLSKSKLTLTIGETSTLKISGTTKAVKWSTDKKAVASVNQKGKVTAKKVGTAKIKATVEGKSYTCTVTVKTNSLITKAPFKAKQTNIGKINFVIPTAYSSLTDSDPYGGVIYYPTKNDPNTNGNGIIVRMAETGKEAMDYDIFEEYCIASFENELEAYGIDFEVSEYKTKNGTAFVVKYSLEMGEIALNYTIYAISMDNYTLNVIVMEHKGEKASPAVKTVGKYILDSITVK